MKRLTLLIAVAAAVVGGGYYAYTVYLPDVVAESIVSGEVSPVVPDKYRHQLERAHKPVNRGADMLISTLYQASIPLEEILKAIDGISEREAYAMLDELNQTELQSQNQVFDLLKRRFPVDFDVEVLREPFRRQVSMATVRKGIASANQLRESQEVDFETARGVVKRILILKEQEFNQALTGQ